jgi:hypothetical protein
MDIEYKKRKQVNASTRHKKEKAKKKLYRIIEEAINNISGLQSDVEIPSSDRHELEADLISIGKYLYVRLTGREIILDKVPTTEDNKNEDKEDDEDQNEDDED